MSQSLSRPTPEKSFHLHSLFVLGFLLFSRILSIVLVPLNDSTEARYGEIARKMLETGNWVTPLHDYGVPFWAKPPLSTWLSASSMGLFGVNEWAVRLPALLLSIAILWLVWDLAKKQSGARAATAAILFLAGSLYFFLDAGTVMTDPSLLFCTTLSLTAFWHTMQQRSASWAYLFFAGLGLGLLAKGPIAVVLVGMPIFFWTVFYKQWSALWRNFPWIKGTLLVAAIALPWYIMAEIRTPGFLKYFIGGEHFGRFLYPGWAGDKYGFAHKQPLGMIWIYILAGIFPWSVAGLFWLRRHGKQLPVLFRQSAQNSKGWIPYLLLWIVLPLFFFTFASNIIYLYVFPCLPACALLFAELWNRSMLTKTAETWLICLSTISGICFLLATAVFIVKPEVVAKSQKPVIAVWKKQDPSLGGTLVYWSPVVHYSAQFYSAAKARATKNTIILQSLLSSHLKNFIVVSSNDLHQIPDNLRLQFKKIATIQISEKSKLFILENSMDTGRKDAAEPGDNSRKAVVNRDY